jgi:hypothetical protein
MSRCSAPTQPEVGRSDKAASSVISTHRVVGLGYIVFGALNMSLMSTCIKVATYYVTSHEAVFWRSVLSHIRVRNRFWSVPSAWI